jgi:hypothetical protein
MADVLKVSNTSGLTNNNDFIGGEYKAGEKFQTASDQINISRIDVYLVKVGSPSGDCTMNIYLASSGLPSGNSLGSSAVSNSSISTSNSWIVFNFNPVISVSSSTGYCFGLTSSGSAFSVGIKQLRTSSDNYSNGTIIRDLGAGWTIYSTYDAGFKVYEDLDLSLNINDNQLNTENIEMETEFGGGGVNTSNNFDQTVRLR